MGLDCTYCGCDVHAHDPVFVAELDGEERTETGRFCNYGCLASHIQDAGLAVGTSCRLDA